MCFEIQEDTPEIKYVLKNTHAKDILGILEIQPNESQPRYIL